MMHLDNSGQGPLRVPGYGGVPLDYQHPFNLRFASGFHDYQQTPAITARELEMLDVMSVITDKPDWYIDIFDNTIAEQWRQEFGVRSLVSDQAWSWCLAELKDKASKYDRQRFVQILDAGSCVCKSDECIPESILKDLQAGLHPFFQDCLNDHGKAPIAIEPSMFPLIHGESRVLKQGGRIHLADFGGDRDSACGPILAGPRMDRFTSEVIPYIDDGSEPYLQRLPCDVGFLSENGTAIEITSPINNLHPSHKAIYAAIEKVISASIPLWNDCLIKASDKTRTSKADQTQQGRIPLRIVTYGASWDNEPLWEEVANSKRLSNKIAAYHWAASMMRNNKRTFNITVNESRYTAADVVRYFSWVKQLPPVHTNTKAARDRKLPKPKRTNPDPAHSFSYNDPKDCNLPKPTWRHPNPGESFSYDDWKDGLNVDRQVVKMIAQRSLRQPVLAGPTHTRYNVTLQESFRKSGLQVIVEIGGAHFPDCRPRTIPVSDGLHTELVPTPEIFLNTFEDHGRSEVNPNEHIVATSLYVYDMTGVEGTIEFKQFTPMPSSVYRYENSHHGLPICCTDEQTGLRTFRNGDRDDELQAMAEVFGFTSRHDIESSRSGFETAQRLGSIQLSQGRLLTFPSTLESSLTIRMQGGHETGHLRWVKIHLVDPHYRICSTANVLPQQRCWSLCGSYFLERQLPRELIDQIVSNVPATISDERAKRLRRIMEERSMRRTGLRPGDRYNF